MRPCYAGASAAAVGTLRQMNRSALLVLAAAGAWGCGMDMPRPGDPGVVCTAIAVSSLNVTVRDAATGARVCDASVVAILANGERHELMAFPPDPQSCAYAGPWERAGLFEVRAQRAGYGAASRTGVLVTADECHVIPVAVSLDLRPE